MSVPAAAVFMVDDEPSALKAVLRLLRRET
jgi:hypothetical protein